jgi:RNA polymerase sigma factor (sigma-70 family)
MLATQRRRAAPEDTVPAVDERDHILVDRIAAGDDEALAEAFDRYGAFVFGLARRVARDTSVAEEVVQEVFAALWRRPERFDAERGSLRAFLGVQAHRRAIDAIRSEASRAAREERHGLDAVRTARDCDGVDEATIGEVVRNAVDRLPFPQRRAVELAFWGGHTYREVAALLGIPEGTAKSRLRLAQAKLGEWLAPLALEIT